jgi:hypothetical protein
VWCTKTALVTAPFLHRLQAAGCRRRSISRRLRLESKHFIVSMIYSWGFGRREAFMHPLSASDVFLTVAIMSVTFLIEVGFFILIGMF